MARVLILAYIYLTFGYLNLYTSINYMSSKHLLRKDKDKKGRRREGGGQRRRRGKKGRI